jgi:hydroxylaminobenzene mutase
MNETMNQGDWMTRRLLQLGMLLFLLGLLTGFGMPLFENPRMGLSSHLEGVLNGLFLLLLGLLWPALSLSRRQAGMTFGLVIYGSFANWAATLMAALWGAGRSMPIAAAGVEGLAWQEGLIDLLLYSLSFAMLAVCGMVLWGLRSLKDRRTGVRWQTKALSRVGI